jgi:CheY-like chemotaxis protein
MDNGFHPDLVIHECYMLKLDDDEIGSEKAAKAAYAKCVKRGFPVVVLSGSDEMAHHSPYADHPPLDWLTKPVDKEKIDLAVERYLAFRQR